MLRRKEILNELIAKGLVTRDQARTLPTISQLRAAHHAGARELAARGKSEGDALYRAFRSTQTTPKTLESSTDNVWLCFRVAQTLFNDARLMDDLVQSVYSTELERLAKHRNGGEHYSVSYSDNFDGSGEGAEFEYGHLILKHLPASTTALFIKTAEGPA